ncbi:CYTH domain-containing protein [Rhizobium leguminosarum]|uniref:CYTH domain-containing protein n=1 Tax=Rhizobium leguminosarum TaxID=384 RepID=UPI00358E4C01
MEPVLSEIEIKLDLSDETLDVVLSSNRLGKPHEVIEQTSTYFDTPDRRWWVTARRLNLVWNR